MHINAAGDKGGTMKSKKIVPTVTLVMIMLLSIGCGNQQNIESTGDKQSEPGAITDSNFTAVKYSMPQAGTNNAAISETISITFDERVDTSTVGPENIMVLENGAPLSGTISSGGQVISFTPERQFSYEALVTVNVANVKETNGKIINGIFSFSFKTQAAPDTAAPYIVSSAVNESISIKVSEDISDPESVVPSMTDEKNNILSGDLSYNKEEMTFIFKPDTELAYQTNYKLTLFGVSDVAGNLSDLIILFATPAAPDKTEPSAPVLSFVEGTRATLAWSAPGDDGYVGTAAGYSMKRSDKPIETIEEFNEAETIHGLPPPAISREAEAFVIPNLGINEDSYIALRAFDEAGNGSKISSVHIKTAASKNYLTETISNNAVNDYYGFALSGGCDINGDGLKDFVTSSPYDDISGADTGRVFVYFGDEPQGSSLVAIINSIDSLVSSADDYFGYSISCDHDFNGDGLDDILVGAPREDTINGAPSVAVNSGAAYLFYGKKFDAGTIVTASDANVIFQGRIANDGFGNNVAAIGDVNNDGLDDIAITAPWGEIVHANEGVVYIYYGSDIASGSVIYDINANMIISGIAAGTSGGLYGAVRSGDIDGDGILDLAFVAATYPAANRGTVYIWLGKHGLPTYIDLETTPADISIAGTNDTEYLGTYAAMHPSISLSGDINNDGIDDLTIGAAYFDPLAGVNAGAVFVFFGREEWKNSYLPTQADVIISGAAANDMLGASVDTDGDYNNDGINDLLVGAAKFATGGGRGGAFIFYGNEAISSLLNIFDADVVITQANIGYADIKLDNILHSDDYLGSSLCFTGDVNGDGYDDILLGAYGNESGAMPTNAGAAYLIW